MHYHFQWFRQEFLSRFLEVFKQIFLQYILQKFLRTAVRIFSGILLGINSEILPGTFYRNSFTNISRFFFYGFYRRPFNALVQVILHDSFKNTSADCCSISCRKSSKSLLRKFLKKFFRNSSTSKIFQVTSELCEFFQEFQQKTNFKSSSMDFFGNSYKKLF